MKKFRARHSDPLWKEKYEKAIKDAEKQPEVVGEKSDYEFTVEDYAYHINETSGKVLPCSEEYYK